jgi:putative oxidoreductase
MGSAHEVGRDRPAVAWALLVARVIVGVIFIAHGSQKLFGAFGGPGTGGGRENAGTHRLSRDRR